MQPVPINYLAVLVAALANFFIGALWYGPLFGKPWGNLIGISHERAQEIMKKGMVKMFGLQFLGALAMSLVLAHALVFAAAFIKVSGVPAGLMTGFWNWLGFIAPVTLGVVLWEGKSWKLWFINNGYWLFALLVQGIILAVWTK